MSEDDYSINTNCVVAAVINKKIQQAGFNWQTSPTQNTADNIVIKTLLRVCDEFEKRYEKDFSHLSTVLDELHLTCESYTSVLDHVVVEGLNWGRVIAIFSFAGAMAVRCMQKGQPNTVDWIREWTCSYLHSRVESWIQNNNGWKGMVEFYGTNKEAEKSKGWGLMAWGAVGAVALGALIINRA